MSYAVITGATEGIGRAIAENLLAHGFSVAVCARNKKKLHLLQQEWSDAYPKATILCISANLGIKEETFAFADAVLAKFPRIDILVNNAGVYMSGSLADEPDGHLEDLMNVNLFSAYHLTRKLLPLIKKGKGGHIFNMCSVASLRAYTNGGSYSITKYALLGFSDNLREELKPFEIKVTSICPGAVYTNSWAGSGVEPERIMEVNDIAISLWSAYSLSPQANVDTIVLRPVKGDL